MREKWTGEYGLPYTLTGLNILLLQVTECFDTILIALRREQLSIECFLPRQRQVQLLQQRGQLVAEEGVGAADYPTILSYSAWLPSKTR